MVRSPRLVSGRDAPYGLHPGGRLPAAGGRRRMPGFGPGTSSHWRPRSRSRSRPPCPRPAARSRPRRPVPSPSGGQAAGGGLQESGAGVRANDVFALAAAISLPIPPPAARCPLPEDGRRPRVPPRLGSLPYIPRGGGVIPNDSRTYRLASRWKSCRAESSALTTSPWRTRFTLLQNPSSGTPPIPVSK